MKKILFAVDDVGISGLINVVNNLCVALSADKGLDINVLCLSVHDRNKMGLGLQVFDLDLNKYGKKQRYLKLIPALKDYFSQHQFDTLVVCGMEFVPFYFAACKNIKGMKKIAWEHRNFNTYPKYRLEWFGRRIACRYFDQVVCLTKRDLSYYLSYKNDPKKIRHIYNIMRVQKSSEAYDEKSKMILSVGDLKEIKGFDMLIDIADKALRKYDGWTWEIYGIGPDMEKLQNMVKERKLEGIVSFKGYSKDISSVYKHSSFYVLTSRAEGMPAVLVEAKRFHLPIISFDIDCGPSDVIRDGVNGCLIKPYDVAAMCEKVCDLIENPEKRKMMSDNSGMDLSGFETENILNSWKEIL